MADGHDDHHGCAEYAALTRRDLLFAAGGLGFSALLPAWLALLSVTDY